MGKKFFILICGYARNILFLHTTPHVENDFLRNDRKFAETGINNSPKMRKVEIIADVVIYYIP